jgi:predicted phage terminase large subunit-like protein
MSTKVRSSRDPLEAILRRDLLAFTQRCFTHLHPGTVFHRNWHHEALSYELERVLAGENNRLIINVQPRSLKSLFGSIALPAFVLGRNPQRRILCASYSQDLAVKLGSDFRKIVEADWYRSAFRPKPPVKNTETEYQTPRGGFRYTTSVGGTLTGRGGDIITVDDPLSASEAMSKTTRDRTNAWFTGTLLPRLDDKSVGAIIVIMQRLHQDDLSGYLLEQGGWTHLKLPAIAPTDMEVAISATKKHFWRVGTPLHETRESLRVLESLKRQLGTDFFNPQYLQETAPEAGNLLKREWLRRSDVTPVRQQGDEIIQSWDTAMKATDTSDYSVCLTFLVVNKNQYHLIDLYRGRLEFPELSKLVVSHAQRYQANPILIEDRSSGTSLIQQAKANGLQGVIPMKSSSDKASRMYGQTPKLEAGSLHLPKTAPWLDDFLTEYLAFPKSRHDDQIDALSQFLEWRANRESGLFEYDFGFDDPAIPTPDFILHRFGRG